MGLAKADAQERRNLKCDAYINLEPADAIVALNEDYKVLEIMSPGHAVAENSIGLFWNKLSDYLTDNPIETLQDLDKLSSILHKVTSSATQLNTIKAKRIDNCLIRELEPQESDTSTPPSPPSSVSLEKVRIIKQNLSHILEVVDPGHGKAENVITYLCNSLHRLLSNTPLPPLDTFFNYSTIIHKMASSYNQLKTIEVKLLERFPIA